MEVDEPVVIRCWSWLDHFTGSWQWKHLVCSVKGTEKGPPYWATQTRLCGCVFVCISAASCFTLWFGCWSNFNTNSDAARGTKEGSRMWPLSPLSFFCSQLFTSRWPCNSFSQHVAAKMTIYQRSLTVPQSLGLKTGGSQKALQSLNFFLKIIFFKIFYSCIVPMGFLPWGNSGCFPQGKPAATVMIPSLWCMLGNLVFPQYTKLWHGLQGL